jgi:crotonobetainyl-CoA:carnitine CoA-transferase CaiB-like acyl-CoA transferase
MFGRISPAGAVLEVIAGVWVLVQVFKGGALQRLGVVS